MVNAGDGSVRTVQQQIGPQPVGQGRIGLGRRTLRLTAATLAGAAAATTSRILGRGAGTAIKGAVILKLDPQALPKLLAGKQLAMVSGTNGKTTTTHLLAAAVRAGLDPTGARVVHNADGANLHGGIAATLSSNPKAVWALIETDERVVADLIRLGRPKVLVLLNFSRDQLDRHHEITALARSWRDALTAAGPDGPAVIANADEPLVVWAAQAAHRVVWVDTATSWTEDAALCPECGALLIREQPNEIADGGEIGAPVAEQPTTADQSDAPDQSDAAAQSDAADQSDAAAWRCSACTLAQPSAGYRVVDGDIIDPAGDRFPPNLQLPGAFNISNAACAAAAAAELGVDTETALAGMRSVTSPAGRFATARFGPTTARLLLAKNPAGWAEALPLATSQRVVLAIDSAAADGRDVSWLWDVDYEQLAGRSVIATGPRAQDLAVRLAYAGVDYLCLPDLAEALTGHTDPVDVIATYTPFQRLRKMGGV